MGSNRIQKLLFSEYSDLEDIVLVEGPFAETDRQGKGIRQVQIGLTPTKLILASYFVHPVATDMGQQGMSPRGQDLDVESFELVSAYPVESVNLSVYRHRRRQTLKARFCNGKVVYYEIGGWQERKMLWSLWCERIKFLSPYESGHSVSETSVGSSSSRSSSLYIVRSSLSVTQTGTPTLWNHYACAESSWMDPHVYLGPQFYDKGFNSSSLYGGAGDMTKNRSTSSRKTLPTRRKRCSKERLIMSTQHEVMAVEAVEAWERRRSSGHQPRIRRRYALHPCPYLLEGIGLWRVSRAQGYSIQTKKNVSVVDLREDAEEFRSLIPKACLLRTVSMESLGLTTSLEKLCSPLDTQSQRGELSFWTRYPEGLFHWGSVQYKAQQRFLRTVRNRSDHYMFGMRRKTSSHNRLHRRNTSETPSTRPKNHFRNSQDNKGCGDSTQLNHFINDKDEEGWLLPVTRFSSSALAHQLTMVHSELFQKISTLDLARAREDGCSWRTPSLRDLVFFSYRISCVVASFILLEQEVQKRARVIGKFMSMAYNCHLLQTQMSAEAVLMGLHCPAVYRLRHTWAYVRKHHATNYRRFEDLSKRYLDCRQPLYQKTYDDLTQVPPFLPSLSLLVAVMIGRLPEPPQVQSFKFSATCSESCHRTTTASPLHMSSSATVRTLSTSMSARRFTSAFQLHHSPPSQHSTCQSSSHVHLASREDLLEHLDLFFAPVSEAPSSRVLQDIEYFLESHQAAASRYQMPINHKVRAFLLHARHPDIRTLYKQSLLIEP